MIHSVTRSKPSSEGGTWNEEQIWWGKIMWRERRQRELEIEFEDDSKFREMRRPVTELISKKKSI